jgi:hypothetical protein
LREPQTEGWRNIANTLTTGLLGRSGFMEVKVPVVQAEVTLFPELSHGRELLTAGQYRPHIVIGPQSQRVATRDGNVITEKYLGVMFVGGPDTISPGQSAEVSLALMYFPDVDYSEVRLGATFTIREGPFVVGFGAILSDPEQSPQMA